MNASKLWNVGRWTIARVWDACGQIPGTFDLQSYLKSHERYADLHSQSSQRVLAELGEAFTSWYGHRNNENQNANPPGYRKRGDDHPRSTVTFKAAGFKHDAENDRIRLSKGSNLKDRWSDFTLCEYDVIGPPGTNVENVQQVRAVYENGVWRLHIVCRHDIEVESPGDGTAGVDLGISNIAAVSFGVDETRSVSSAHENAPRSRDDETLLFPGGWLKESNTTISASSTSARVGTVSRTVPVVLNARSKTDATISTTLSRNASSPSASSVV